MVSSFVVTGRTESNTLKSLNNVRRQEQWNSVFNFEINLENKLEITTMGFVLHYATLTQIC